MKLDWLQRISTSTKIALIIFCGVPAAVAVYLAILTWLSWTSGTSPDSQPLALLFLLLALAAVSAARWFWSLNLDRLFWEFARMAVEDGVTDLFKEFVDALIGDSPRTTAQRIGLTGMVRAHRAARF
jgi:hypothetical protein